MADSYGHQPASPEISPHSDNEGGHYGSHDASVREQDRFLPIANVSRIMKKALPSNAKISKDAKETVQECVSEFISFITGVCCDCGFLFDRILTFRLYVADSCSLMWCHMLSYILNSIKIKLKVQRGLIRFLWKSLWSRLLAIHHDVLEVFKFIMTCGMKKLEAKRACNESKHRNFFSWMSLCQ